MDEDRASPTNLLNGEPPDQPHCTPVVSDITQPAVNSDTVKEYVSNRGCFSNHHNTIPLKSAEPGLWDRLNEETEVKVLGRTCSSSPVSESSALDRDFSLSSGNYKRQPRADSPPLALAPGTQHSENTAASFRWPPSYQLHGSAEDRAAYFNGLKKNVDPVTREKAPAGPQAATLLDLMSIRASNSKLLRRFSLGTAVGFRTKQGDLTNVPAIIVFVAHKVNCKWLDDSQRLPVRLEGPGGVWCDVDVVEFAYYGAQAVTPKEQVYTELVEGLRGNDPCIGPGSQVASQETCGTLGAIVQSRSGARQVGFLTNRHVAVDLDYPSQKMFHPLPPNIGPGVYLGAVERATSFITDNCWYNIFASMNPETFVRADGAFIPFGDKFDVSRVTTTVKGVGNMGEVMGINLQDPISNVVGRQVVKVGRSSGLTKGIIMAYALEYNDEKGICFFTDFLIVGENKQAFDLEGDSGSLVLMTECGQNPRPVGIIWGGTANRGRLKLRNGHGPENWTSGVDLGRLLEWLQLDLITSDTALTYAIEEQRRLTLGESTEGECSPRRLGIDRPVDANQHFVFDSFSKFSLQNQNRQFVQGEELYFEELGRCDDLPLCNQSPIEFIKDCDFETLHLERRHTEKEEHGDLSNLKKIGSEDPSFDLNLYDRDVKRRRL